MNVPAPDRPAPRTEVEATLRCERPRPVPLFLPAIYEHKAAFIGSTPTAISRDGDLLTRAMLAEYAAIQPDALVVGVDVYNVEAEAVGSIVTFYEGKDTSIPGIKPEHHIVEVGMDLSAARLPNPARDGRMPVNLAAARAVRKELGDDFWLRGAVSGPFSLAISLVGAESLFIACIEQPEWVRSCLDYASRIIREFAKGYIDAGVELIMFDSQASPELLSPSMYEEFVLPVTQEFVAWAKTQGVRDLPLIIGGNTTKIVDMLVQTGANNLLCDFTADFEEWSGAVRSAGRAFRRNISPRLLEKAPAEEIYEVARREVERGRDIPGFIMGTAVVPFGTPTPSIRAVKQACLDAARS
ncbi:uroporphyrinogen decarboxylase family protein [Opitutus terrae]|uniref:Uroporphyrinogen decarboxylase (URO-D) n=1 Tax=Opitutus terrae (strain DSM 11246 / JCM 15787 / PB90-1) TaxID=452637 RepID=B1ZXB6_OPITP|nr:uroporphyrinogen decarboxylase family protein [Opitutus terrae]ACB76168.1 Uroporphyrinogen decarboxylase (URO-D) [Opitutus terrae PB90-1]